MSARQPGSHNGNGAAPHLSDDELSDEQLQLAVLLELVENSRSLLQMVSINSPGQRAQRSTHRRIQALAGNSVLVLLLSVINTVMLVGILLPLLK